MDDETLVAEDPVTPQIAEVLVANHRDFLRFVERRIGNRALAEEIVQDASIAPSAREKTSSGSGSQGSRRRLRVR